MLDEGRLILMSEILMSTQTVQFWATQVNTDSAYHIMTLQMHRTGVVLLKSSRSDSYHRDKLPL